MISSDDFEEKEILELIKLLVVEQEKAKLLVLWKKFKTVPKDQSPKNNNIMNKKFLNNNR